MEDTSRKESTRSRDKRGGRDRDRQPLDSFAKLYERPLPFSLEAEMALLGSMIIDPRTATDVMTIVDGPEDFYKNEHGRIYQAILDVYDRIPDADLIAMVDVLRERGELEQIGGPEYLGRLANETPSAAAAPHYAKVVASKARLRRLMEAADQIIYDVLHMGDFGVDGAREVIDLAESRVFEIAQEDQKAEPQALGALLEKEIKRIEAAEGKGISGIATGFFDLDGLLSGMQPGEMIVLAARPSMGKTAMALNIAEQVARGGKAPGDQPQGAVVPVGVFSLEMSKSALVQRLLSAFSQVDSQRMRTGHLNQQEMTRLRIHAEGLAETPIFIDDTPGITVLALRARARRMVAQHGIRAVIIDYLQLLTAPGSSRESRQVEVSAISRGLKALARELNVPVVCLSQLNRASEQREGNRPRMSDLRESGSIEQDADVVMLLHREDYYHSHDPGWAEENQDKVNVAELIIAKQRNGPTGVVHLTWDPRTTRFKNHAGYQGSWGGGASGGSVGSSPFDAPAPEPKPMVGGGPPVGQGQRSAFPAGPRTGPVADHRDGGGPDRDADEGDVPPF